MEGKGDRLTMMRGEEDAPRFLGTSVNDKFHLRCNWHHLFSFKVAGRPQMYISRMLMSSSKAMQTTLSNHCVGCFYPLRNTEKTVQLLRFIGEDTGEGVVVFRGDEPCSAPKHEQWPLNDLLLLMQYSDAYNGACKTHHTATIPILSPRSPLKAPPLKTQREIESFSGTSIAGISVGGLSDVCLELRKLTPHPIDIVVTHVSEPECRLRTFDSIKNLASAEHFKTQGSMDDTAGNTGLTCGLEAAYNCGFPATADWFADASFVNAEAFLADGNGSKDDNDTYLTTTGGGNNITPELMYSVLKEHTKQEFVIENIFPFGRSDVGSDEFWENRKFAIIAIRLRSGLHWVSMEKIIMNGNEVFCLREGRGGLVRDFTDKTVRPHTIRELKRKVF
jgi:hypothetical protein